MTILILGGTTEARQLCQTLESRSGHHIIFSLAGLTNSAPGMTVETRIGGFGGVEGLADYLRASRINAIIDATHPFAAQMSRHAVHAAQQCKIPLMRLTRPAWQASPSMRWQHVPDIAHVPALLGDMPLRVFLTTGRKELTPFLNTPHRYLLRCIEPPHAPMPAETAVILARGPFSIEGETRLLEKHRIECLVTKNAGASATFAKLEAARRLGIRVIMVDRPILPPALECPSVEEALTWLQGIRRSV